MLTTSPPCFILQTSLLFLTSVLKPYPFSTLPELSHVLTLVPLQSYSTGHREPLTILFDAQDSSVIMFTPLKFAVHNSTFMAETAVSKSGTAVNILILFYIPRIKNDWVPASVLPANILNPVQKCPFNLTKLSSRSQ